MMYINLDVLVGEAGGILISAKNYNEYLAGIPSEEVGSGDNTYNRLINLPSAKQAYSVLGTLIILTMEGQLMLADNNNPDGVIIDLGLPPLQRIWQARHFMVLDMNNTLHFIDIGKVAKTFNLAIFHTPSSGVTKIENVLEITETYYQDFVDTMVIVTTSGTLMGNIYDIWNGNTQLVKDPTIKIIGNTHELIRDGQRYIKDDSDYLPIPDDIIDAAMFVSEVCLLSNSNEIISKNTFSERERIFPNASRFLINNGRVLLFVEDTLGNVYIIPDSNMRSSLEDIKPFYLPVRLSQPHKTGRMTKRALQ